MRHDIRFENAGTLHQDLVIPIKRFQVVVGQNGCGKTTMLNRIWSQECQTDSVTAYKSQSGWAQARAGAAIDKDADAKSNFLLNNPPISMGQVRDQLSRYFEARLTPLLILIDDISSGLHPKAHAELVAAIRNWQKELMWQIIASCYCPYFLDSMAADEVMVLARPQTGPTRAKLLSQHPSYEQRKGDLTTGEFWSSVGEDWVLEG